MTATLQRFAVALLIAVTLALVLNEATLQAFYIICTSEWDYFPLCWGYGG